MLHLWYVNSIETTLEDFDKNNKSLHFDGKGLLNDFNAFQVSNRLVRKNMLLVSLLSGMDHS